MKVLIIGYGSIGQRHFSILQNIDKVTSIDIVTKQNIKIANTFTSINDVKNLNSYDYFVIASETVKHFDQLEYICSKVENKKILVEKPLYDKKYEKITTDNIIFTAYNLRFHPVINKLKEILKDETIYYANVMCGQYLPSWRPEQDYTKSYSADTTKGGGVLRDLSHELDYAWWLFGDLHAVSYINTKISDLEINSDDIFTALFTTKSKSIVNLTIDYISKTPIRKIIVQTQEKTIEADVINSVITINDKNSNLNNVKINKINRNYTYSKMHDSLLNNEYDNLCTFTDGHKIVNLIDSISYSSFKDL